MGNPVFLYDGVCGLCNRTVQFILKHDPKEVFRFAPLQGAFAKDVLRRHGANAEDLDTVYVVMNVGGANESLLARSDAVLFVLRNLGGWQHNVAWLVQCLPHRLRDWGYRLVARHRYQIFGRYPTCPIPTAEVRERFLDL